MEQKMGPCLEVFFPVSCAKGLQRVFVLGATAASYHSQACLALHHHRIRHRCQSITAQAVSPSSNAANNPKVSSKKWELLKIIAAWEPGRLRKHTYVQCL